MILMVMEVMVYVVRGCKVEVVIVVADIDREFIILNLKKLFSLLKNLFF